MQEIPSSLRKKRIVSFVFRYGYFVHCFIVKEMLQSYSATPSTKYDAGVIEHLVLGIKDYSNFIQLVKRLSPDFASVSC